MNLLLFLPQFILNHLITAIQLGLNLLLHYHYELAIPIIYSKDFPFSFLLFELLPSTHDDFQLP